MRKTQYAWLVVLTLSFLIGIIWHFHRSSSANATIRSPAVAQHEGAQSVAKAKSGTNALAAYPQISLQNQSKEQATQIWLQRVAKDKSADWKAPVDFFGKVVDQNSKPVENADVSFQWTDLSDRGSTTAVTHSDHDGLFRLAGVAGDNR